jgi:hypothetical protein
MPNGFQWDPNADQTFTGLPDILYKPAPSFNKTQGKSFTMNAPAQTLVLQLAHPADSYTTVWGDGSTNQPSVIAVKQGFLIYDASNAKEPQLVLGRAQTSLTVSDDGQFIVKNVVGAGASVGLAVASYGALDIDVANSGIIDIDCTSVDLSPLDVNAPPDPFRTRIDLQDKARMTVVCSDFKLTHGDIDVGSSPNSGYALFWSATGAGASMNLARSTAVFAGTAGGFFGCPALTLTSTHIEASERAACYFQFDSVVPQGGSQFVLGPNQAKMQFDSYSGGNVLPFDFLNKDYPEGLFNCNSKIVDAGEFVVRESSAFGANAMLSKKLIAIDGQIQDAQSTRVNITFEGGYGHVKQVG